MADLIQKLRQIAQDKADNANYARASYCAGRAGCDDLRDIRSKPEDYLEWKAADEIDRLRAQLKSRPKKPQMFGRV